MSKSRFDGAVPLALVAAFAAGAAVDGWLRTHGPPKPMQVEDIVWPDTTEKTAAISAPRVPPPSAAMSSPLPPSVGAALPPPQGDTARLAEARSAREGGRR